MRRIVRETDAWVAVAGAGAIGGVLAVSMRRAGREVAIITRSPGPIARKGITVRAPSGKRYRAGGWLEVSRRAGKRPGCAAVFLCVKAPDIVRAIRAVKPLVGPDTAVVSLLNGLSHIAPLKHAFGPRRTVFGACYIASNRTGPAAVWHTGGDFLMLGRTKLNAAAVKASEKILKHAGWKIKFTGDPDRILWTKTVFNAAVNPLGALAKSTNGGLVAEPALKALLISLLKEGLGIAKAAGIKPIFRDMESFLIKASRSLPNQVNSMAQDLASGRKTEADSILKPLIDSARRTGAPAERLGAVYRILRRLERAS